jgi:hypothetical protein
MYREGSCGRDGTGLVVLCEGVDTLRGDEGVLVLHRRWQRAGDQERLRAGWLTATTFLDPDLISPK